MITITPNEAAFDQTASERILSQMKAKPQSVIGLSTGRTTKNMHLLAGEAYRKNPFDVSQVTIFGIDEVTGVDREYAGACYKMLKTEIIEALGIDDEHYVMLPTRSNNFDEECKRFTQTLAQRGGIDLIMLGLGENGHLGFNQPGTPLGQGAWTTRMNIELEERIRRETQTPESEPLGGVTLGLRDIMHARRIVLVAKGKNKAEAVSRMLTGAVSPDCPASVLQLHPNCEFLLDEQAASLLPKDLI